MAKLNDERPDTEYSIEIDENNALSNYSSKNVSVIGKMKGPSVRYNLNTLMKSDSPKHKEILKSLILNTVQKKLYGGFKCLLHNGYQISPLNDDNQTALHLAFYQRASGIITEFEAYLDSEYSQEPNQPDYTDMNGLTHLHVACAMGDIRLIDVYSKHSANINSRFTASNEPEKRYNGFTPLHFVMINADHQSEKMLQLLIERGADINAVDDMGRNPLHIISSFSNSKFQWYRHNTVQVMQALIDLKVDINAKDATGNIPLFMVLSSYDEAWLQLTYDMEYLELIKVMDEKLKLLLEAGSDVDAKNNNNETVLHFAVRNLKISRRANLTSTFEYEDSKIIKSLELIMSHKPDIDVNVRNKNDETPLLLAVTYLSVDVVEFLLNYNAESRSLMFDHENNDFFTSYGVYIPKFFRNLITILELLRNDGFVSKPEDNLAVLKFFITDRRSLDDCDGYNSAIFYIICMESPEHLKSILNDFFINFRYDFYDSRDKSDDYLDHFEDLHAFLLCIQIGDVFMNQDSKVLIEETVNKCKELHTCWAQRVEADHVYEELDDLESIILQNGKTMGDALMEKPEKLVEYFGINNFDESCLNDLRFFDGIVEGYVTICMIRYYVINLSYDIAKKLHCTPLPYLCYELVTNHLSNIDILNLCLAILT